TERSTLMSNPTPPRISYLLYSNRRRAEAPAAFPKCAATTAHAAIYLPGRDCRMYHLPEFLDLATRAARYTKALPIAHRKRSLPHASVYCPPRQRLTARQP